VESDDVQSALSKASALFDQGDQRAALELLEALRVDANRNRDAGLVDELLHVARGLAARSNPRDADGYRQLLGELEQNLAYLEGNGPASSRAVVWAGRRRVAAMVGLCVVVPGLGIAATGNTTIALLWTELGLFASPVPFFAHGERWGAPKWLCGVAAVYVLGSAALCLLIVVFVAWAGGPIALGLLVASLAGALALVGCVTSGGSLRTLVAFQSIAAAGIAGALALIGSDSERLHHVEGGAGTEQSVADLSGLYTIWATAAVMILTGVAVATLEFKRPRGRAGSVPL
jgi:hypothetical protein